VLSLALGSRISALNENPSGLKCPTMSWLGPLQVLAPGVTHNVNWTFGGKRVVAWTLCAMMSRFVANIFRSLLCRPPWSSRYVGLRFGFGNGSSPVVNVSVG